MSTRYLTADVVIAVNRGVTRVEGQLRDFGLLESAVLRPQQTVGGEDAYPSITMKASAMFVSLIANHPFIDGNKRTAVVAMGMFLRMNGLRLWADDLEIVTIADDVAARRATLDDVDKLLQRRTEQLWGLGDEVSLRVVVDDELPLEGGF